MAKLLRIQAIAAYCLFALALGYVIVDQARDEGLQRGHRGWCSAHVLAIIERATFSNALVGHSMEYTFDHHGKSFFYFDRYPPFFSAVMHGVLNTFDLSHGTKIYVARQVMNLHYVATLAFAAAMLIEVGMAPGLAVGAVALAGSGRLLTYYRDMIHFDQAAMLGFMALLWAIARWYRTKNDRLVYIATVLAVLWGRGYASFAVLGVFWLVEAVRLLAANYRTAPRAILLSVQTGCCLIAIALAAGSIAYNCAIEANRRDLPFTEVGIIKSAAKRLTLDKTFNKSKKGNLAWPKFSRVIAERGVSNLHPYNVDELVDVNDRNQLWMTVGGVVLAIFAFIATRKRELRPPLIIAALAGVAWIFPMRGLTAFHDFTTMFLLSMMVVLMAGLTSLFPARVQLLPALLGCAVLVFAVHSRNVDLEGDMAEGVRYTRDLERIAKLLKPRQVLPVEPEPRKMIPGVPYALGFYLPDNPLLLESKIEPRLMLSNKKPSKRPAYTNLTPDNKRLFLYSK